MSLNVFEICMFSRTLISSGAPQHRAETSCVRLARDGSRSQVVRDITSQLLFILPIHRYEAEIGGDRGLSFYKTRSETDLSLQSAMPPPLTEDLDHTA